MTAGSNSAEIRSVHQLRHVCGSTTASPWRSNCSQKRGLSTSPVQVHSMQVNHHISEFVSVGGLVNIACVPVNIDLPPTTGPRS